jgi:hypothetical protein
MSVKVTDTGVTILTQAAVVAMALTSPTFARGRFPKMRASPSFSMTATAYFPRCLLRDHLTVCPVGEKHIAWSGEGPVDPATAATTARHCCSVTICEVTATSP